jgi:hypothetical protein
MPDTARPRLGLQAIAGTDLSNTIDQTNDAQMDIIDAQAVIFSQGSYGARPPSSPATPGIEGRFYFATDEGVLYYDHGTGWAALMPNAGRGKSIVATEQSRSNTAYGTLDTPDQVANVVVPTDGLLYVKFSALVKASAPAGVVGLFVGGTPARIPNGGGAPIAGVETPVGATANDYEWVFTAINAGTTIAGLHTQNAVGNAARDASPIVAGEMIAIEVPAGVYTVSVQYKATSGSITAKERKLWVRSEAY